MPVKVIARVMKVSRNTVRAAIASDRPPRYERPAKGSIVDAAEPRIRELLQACPAMPATVIAERIGWDRSIRVLRDRVAELRPAYLPPDPASRTAPVAGRAARADGRLPGVPRDPGREGGGLQARRPRGQGADRAGPRLPGTLVPARPHVHRPSGLQHPAGRLAGGGEHPPA